MTSDTSRATKIRGRLEELARRRRQAESDRAESMTGTADLLRAGHAAGIPIAHLAQWSELTRRTVYDILSR